MNKNNGNNNNKDKKTKKIFGLSVGDEEDEEGDEVPAAGPGVKGIDGMSRLKESFRRNPEAFAQSIERKMARLLDEYPGEVGTTPKSMVAVKYNASFMGIGTQQAVGRLSYALAQIHRALVREEYAEARFLTLISLAACDQQCLDGNWHTAWEPTPFAQPPWEVWKQRDLGEMRKSYPFSPLMDPAWVSLASAQVREVEAILKKRTATGKQKEKGEQGRGSTRGRGGG